MHEKPDEPVERETGEPAADFLFGRWRQRVENSEVRRHPVALERVVVAAKRVEPSEILRAALSI